MVTFLAEADAPVDRLTLQRQPLGSFHSRAVGALSSWVSTIWNHGAQKAAMFAASAAGHARCEGRNSREAQHLWDAFLRLDGHQMDALA